MKIPNVSPSLEIDEVSLARIVSEDSQRDNVTIVLGVKSSKDS